MNLRISNYILFLLSVITLFSSCHNKKTIDDTILWYRQPAKNWNEALPLGNGRIGIMIFGDTLTEHLQLNDDSMWPEKQNWDEPEGTRADIEKIRNLLLENKNTEADRLFVEKFSRKTIVRSHQTLGDLFINFNHKNITDYHRDLDISKAIATVSYKTNGNLITEELFVSHPHQAIIIKITSNKKNGLNGKVALSRPKDNGHATAYTKTTPEKLLIMQGEITQHNGQFDSQPTPITAGVKFQTCLKIENEDGEIISNDEYLELKNVTEAIFYLVSNSSFYYDDYKKQNQAELEVIAQSRFRDIRKKHIEDYQNLYARVDLKFESESFDSIPTDQRINSIKQGSLDVGLEQLLFQYGRYLLISSSRKRTNPANLQGLWNNHITAPWNADYHLNINLQMNYWHANVTNLDELNMPLFDFIDRLVENGKVTAQKNFGCRGAFIPHATDIWATTWLRAPTAYWGCSVTGGGWLMQHYWQHFLFTQDTSFLQKRAYPAMQQVALFYSDWLTTDPRDSMLISSPSTSPENRFINKNGKAVATCIGSAMDQQVISEVFENFLVASKILNVDNKLVKTITGQKKQLRPGFRIGSDGRILEWDKEYQELEPGHRHMSHLYGFHPGTSVTKSKNPEIFDAVKKTLSYRLANGGAGTGWSRAWLINCSARLLDGKMAHEHIGLLLKKSISPNLFDMHPPFQIDGNFGYTAGIAEMLMQSHEDNLVRILPALPPQWKSGQVKGLKARKGMTFDIIWKNNQPKEITINSKIDNNFDLQLNDKKIPVSVKKGETTTIQL